MNDVLDFCQDKNIEITDYSCLPDSIRVLLVTGLQMYELPTGGKKGQILGKLSDNDEDIGWIDDKDITNITYHTATEEDVSQGIPKPDAYVGEPYLKIVYEGGVNPTYVPLDGLVDIYTAGNGIKIDNNVITSLNSNLENGLGINSLQQKGNKAKAESSIAFGHNTIAGSSGQLVAGQFNKEDTKDKYLFIVGNGDSNDNRKNAFAVGYNGVVEVENSLLINNKQAATEEYTTNNFISNKGNQVLNGSLTITNDLTVNGKTTVVDTETLKVKDNIIVTNSEPQGDLIKLSGLAINKNKDVSYGIMLDPLTNTVLLGEGKLDADGEFTYNNEAGQPVATRSANIPNNNIVMWNNASRQLEDSTINKDDLIITKAQIRSMFRPIGA